MSDTDQQFARTVQEMLGAEESGLETDVDETMNGQERIPDHERRGGGSDDIGDISWVVPTASLRFPSNISGGQGHNWNKAIAMATPIAHKGSTAGAKVHAMTVLDLLLKPELVEGAWDYFNNVQTKGPSVHLVPATRGQTGDLAQQRNYGSIQGGTREVLLRPVAIRYVS